MSDKKDQTIRPGGIPSEEDFGTPDVKKVNVGTAQEVDSALNVHSAKSPATKTDKTSNQVKSVQDSGTVKDSATTMHASEESQSTIVGSGNLQSGKASLKGSGEDHSPGIVTATPEGIGSFKDDASETPQSTISANLNAKLDDVGVEMSGVIQDATGKAATSSKGDIDTTPLNENVSVKDSIDAVVIPGPERATHYSLNDSAATEDSIGFMPYVKALSKLLCHKNTDTPLVVGVFGEWGAGKTTFMRFIEGEVQRLQKQPKNMWWKFWSSWQKSTVSQTWFNAWKYDVQSDLWMALLQAITSQVEGETPLGVLVWRRFRRLLNWRFFWSLLTILIVFGIGVWLYSHIPASVDMQQGETNNLSGSSVSWQYFTALISASLPPAVAAVLLYWLGIFAPAIDLVRRLKAPLGLDVKELLHGKSLPDKIERFRTFEKELETRLNDYLVKDGKLIIYIDDLDRCSPEHAVEIIEAVNLFLETKRCIFVLGMDNNLIENSIELKYKEISKLFDEKQGEGQRRYGQFFLEKIIQIPISVPAMMQEEMRRFVQTELMQHPGLEAVQHVSNSSSSENDKAINAQIENLDIPISKDTQNTFLSLLPYLEPNPRTIKRFYNMLTFIHFFYIANRNDLYAINDVSLTMWFFLQYKFPEEIKKLRSHDKQGMPFRELMIGANGELPEIREFFSRYSSNSEKEWVMEKLDGKVAFYFPITRFLAI